jgi:hypothetical protein
MVCLFLWFFFPPAFGVINDRFFNIECYGAGFLLRILCCSQNGDHPENNLTKIGYITNNKILKKQNKNQNPSIFLATF